MKRIHNNENGKILRIGCEKCVNGDEHNECETETEAAENYTESNTGKYSCNYCKFKSDMKRSMHMHNESKHMRVKKFFCKDCDYKCYFKQQMEGHMNVKHNIANGKISRIGCEKCVNSEEHNCDIRRRKSYKEDYQGKYSCNDCEFKSDLKISMKSHTERLHLGKMKFFCKDCDYTCYYKQAIVSHMKRKHDNENGKICRIECIKCVNREEHNICEDTDTGNQLKLKEKVTNIRCSECNHQPFKTQGQRLKHHKEKHPDTTIFKCKDCTYGTNYLTNLNSHISSLHEQKLLHCSKCEYITTWNQSLLAHMRLVHAVFQRESKHFKKGRKFICDSCGMETFYKMLYEAHKAAPNCIDAPKTIPKNTFYRGKKHEYSGISFRRSRTECIPRNNVNQRKKYTDENSKKFKCDKCPFSSDKKGIVKTHTQQIHEQVTFKCDIGDCNRKYRAKYSLKVHVNSFHKGITFDCVICSRKYPSIETLRTHTRVNHENGRVYNIKCKECDFVTYYQKGLESHLQQSKHHE